MGTNATSSLTTETPLLEVTSNPPPYDSISESTPSELERLRDILYGPQSRITNKRFSELEARLETTRREWAAALDEKTGLVAEAALNQLMAARTDWNARLDQQTSDQQAHLKTSHQELAERQTQQAAQQSAQLQAVQTALSARLEQLAADFLTELRASHKALSDRLDALSADHTERLRSLQTEAWSRDEALRLDLATLASTLEQHKVSRQELSQLFIELSQRLRSE